MKIFARQRERFSQLFAKKIGPDDYGALDFNRLPILDAAGLIALTGQQNRLRNIKRIVQIDDVRYQILYQDVIDRFAEVVQLMPASQAHHHAVPGGLFIHTLEVLEYALSLRRQYKLPQMAAQEEQEKQRQVWTYAVFAGVLLHDIGKRLTLCRFETDKGRASDPFAQQLPQEGYYRLHFQSAKYHALHTQIGLAFAARIFPAIGLDFLMTQLHIMQELMAYLHDDDTHAGSIGDIIRAADRASTGQSLAHSPTRKFPGAYLENIGERLMTQLRQLLADNHFVINKSNGNVYTSADMRATYIVSKTLADTLRETLAAQGQSDIPHDNNRVFDILQEYGFAETNPGTGQSIHYIRRIWQDKAQTFSVLKFASDKLFRVLPQPFGGSVSEVAGKNAGPGIGTTKVTQSVTGEPAFTPPVTGGQYDKSAATGDGRAITPVPLTEDDSFEDYPDDEHVPLPETGGNTAKSAATGKVHHDQTATDEKTRIPPVTVDDNSVMPASAGDDPLVRPEGDYREEKTVSVAKTTRQSDTGANDSGTTPAIRTAAIPQTATGDTPSDTPLPEAATIQATAVFSAGVITPDASEMVATDDDDIIDDVPTAKPVKAPTTTLAEKDTKSEKNVAAKTGLTRNEQKRTAKKPLAPQTAVTTSAEPIGATPDNNLDERFFTWCRAKILDKSFVINESSGMVQKVTYKGRDVIAVVSPRIFMRFANEALGLPENKASAERVQKAIHSNKKNIKGPRGQLHEFHILKSPNNPLNGYSKLYHYVFEIDVFCGSDEEVKNIVEKTKPNTNLAHT